MTTTTLKIEGMSCGHCVKAVQSALEGVAGTRVERVDIGSALIEHDSAQVTPADLAGVVTEAGYEAQVEGER